MKLYSVKVGHQDYIFTDEITAKHFIEKCEAAKTSKIYEKKVYQPSMIDELADILNEELSNEEPFDFPSADTAKQIVPVLSWDDIIPFQNYRKSIPKPFPALPKKKVK